MEVYAVVSNKYKTLEKKLNFLGFTDAPVDVPFVKMLKVKIMFALCRCMLVCLITGVYFRMGEQHVRPSGVIKHSSSHVRQ